MKYHEHRIASKPALSVMDRLRDEDQAQRDRGLPVDQRTRNVTAPTGLFLFSLVRSLQPGLLVEIGSSTAYSTIWMALAAREFGGRIVGSEILPDRASEANQNLRDAGLDHVATVVTGDGSDVAANQTAIDMVFLDAEKDDYPRHFENVVGRVRSGGLILTDNVTSHDCSALLSTIRERDDVVTQTLPFERGLEYTVRLK
jgi:caffeoyl-CoA O-methyltransferase